MSAFEPVFLDRSLGNRAAQTFLRHANACMRSAYLYAKYRGEASTVEMQRGRALHTVCERAVKLMIEMGEPIIPPEIVKTLLDEVLGQTPVPLEEHDYLREAVYRWASEWTIDPQTVVACETLFTMRVGDWDVRCRIDFADLREDAAVAHVVDYKSGRGAATQEEVARVRKDGTLHAKNFQLVLYALVLAFGVPIREEPCRACSGKGYTVAVGPANQSTRLACRECGGFDPHLDLPPKDRTPEMQERMGRGVVETPDPFPVAQRAQRFDLAFVYPGIEDREGKMLRRPVTLTRLELEEYRASLAALVCRVSEAERSGDWPAVVSDAACGECPAPSECPIPAQLRDGRGSITTPEEAVETMAWADRTGALVSAARRDARAFTKAQGGLVRADGKALELVYSESEAITDRDAMFSAVERSVAYGEPFDRAEFVKVKGRTELKARELTPEELAPPERSLEEKFGDVPF
jgi:hypothetical protein